MDIAVAPYRPAADFYFSPLKLYEYMAAGKPIVASALGQITEVIADRVNGTLFEPGDSPALATTIAQLIADSAMRKQLGERARQAVKGHDWSHKAVQIQVELQELVNRARSPGVEIS
jgi:glycosyltransferase involved in cell wall biosynthesis